LVGKKLNFIGAYISTEGPIGYEVPSLTGKQHGVYMFHFGDMVYTFRRLQNGNQHVSNPLLGVADLRAGDEVEVFISSPSGLLNYAMGDCLRIKSVSPVISFEILGRLGQGLNIAAEKVPMSQLQEAVALTAQVTGTPIRHFFVYPGKGEDSERPCYEWNLVVDNPNSASEEAFIEALDSTLQKLNFDYQEARVDTGFLSRPKVRLLPSSVTKAYFDRFSHRGQLKMKSAFESKQLFEEFLTTTLGIRIDLNLSSSKGTIPVSIAS
ncbi:MAG TPA: GH3 auxin-responsive promoter family protein, partial [Blastocatellia bacterium]|nr:GH3 auxin-responsive promoter family protein [Blastocatellia bacterium]